MSSEASKNVSGSRKLFSRDANYLRDVTLVWSFIIFSIIAVGCAFSSPNRQLGIRCAALAIVAILLAKERLILFLGALGFCAIQGVVALVVHPWKWPVFAVTLLTGVPFLLANRNWRKPKMAYQLPSEFGAVDMLLSFAAMCGTLFLLYIIAPRN